MGYLGFFFAIASGVHTVNCLTMPVKKYLSTFTFFRSVVESHPCVVNARMLDCFVKTIVLNLWALKILF